jgi:hypothetical protein
MSVGISGFMSDEPPSAQMTWPVIHEDCSVPLPERMRQKVNKIFKKVA